jgi:hypothetical protein
MFYGFGNAGSAIFRTRSVQDWNAALSLEPGIVIVGYKAGYRVFERRFHADEHLQSIVVTLQAAPESSGSGQPPSRPEGTPR